MTSEINSLRQQVTSTAWIQPRQLADADIVFAIKKMENVSGNKFGRQWRLTIEMREDTIEAADIDTGIEEGQTVMVSLPAGDQRDKHFNAILQKRLLPAYNMIFVVIPLPTGNDYIDLVQLEKEDDRWMPPPAPKHGIEAKRPSTAVTFRKRSTGEEIPSSYQRDDFDPFLERDDLP